MDGCPHRDADAWQSVAKSQASDFKPITYDAKPDPELIIKSVLEHFIYLKFRNSFRGIDNYNFAFAQPCRHALFVIELWITWVEMEQNIATIQAVNSSLRL
ncbi:hypothetical protein RhiirA4_460683 [Rhizophagus irregularis]|uniref:Uncharacterized protein n=1 Tax=Rhizophagus irregularis TaxID=588596 RepID=A0A2I1GH39_9GLOM|nr:hypothetical protein RhiirA4_460683 [Rhizophagus irregularis]